MWNKEPIIRDYIRYRSGANLPGRGGRWRCDACLSLRYQRNIASEDWLMINNGGRVVSDVNIFHIGRG